MIKLNDLAIGYNGEAILEHIDQEFDDGLIYGILAKSGAGKTTLLKTISGLLHPVHGEVVIDGTTYRNADKNPVYMMHQRYSNFGWLSCTENVLAVSAIRWYATAPCVGENTVCQAEMPTYG